MSGRNRELTLEDLLSENQDQVDSGEFDEFSSQLDGLSIEDMKVGVGGCWLSDERTCDPSCMAFNHHRLDSNEHPCVVLVSLQSLVDPVAECAGERTEEMKRVRRSVDSMTQAVNNLVTVMQQAASRIR